MTRKLTVFTANGTQKIGTVHKARDLDSYLANIKIWGTFGGGSVAIQTSPDGTTSNLITEKDPATGSAYAATAADSINFREAGSQNNENKIDIYATVSGATNPTINVLLNDNNS